MKKNRCLHESTKIFYIFKVVSFTEERKNKNNICMYRAFWRGNDSHNEFPLRRSDAGGISKYVQDIFRSGGIKTIHHIYTIQYRPCRGHNNIL